MIALCAGDVKPDILLDPYGSWERKGLESSGEEGTYFFGSILLHFRGDVSAGWGGEYIIGESVFPVFLLLQDFAYLWWDDDLLIGGLGFEGRFFYLFVYACDFLLLFLGADTAACRVLRNEFLVNRPVHGV